MLQWARVSLSKQICRTISSTSAAVRQHDASQLTRGFRLQDEILGVISTSDAAARERKLFIEHACSRMNYCIVEQ